MDASNDKAAKIRASSEAAVKNACKKLDGHFHIDKRCKYFSWSELAKALKLSQGDIKALKIFVQSSGYKGPKH